MRLAINLLIVAVILALAYLLISNIQEPIEFMGEKNKRERAVIAKLMEVREAQKAYRGVTGKFASDFDTLAYVLRTGRFELIKVIGNPDDPDDPEVTYDTIYVSAIDSVQNLGINLDSLRYVPYGEGAAFDIQADTVTYQSTLVNVVEVGIPRTAFMGPYADARYAMYDNSYDPKKPLKFGNMYAPNLAGNWE